MKKKRSIWRRGWLERRNEGRGVLAMLNEELLYEDPASYRNFLRLRNDQYEYLLSLVQEQTCKEDTVMRMSVPA